MAQTPTNEETPLLRDRPTDNHLVKRRTPLPWRQFYILLLLQVCEPMTSHLISPFLPQLIRDTGITNGEDSRVGYYVGLMYSLFFFTQACTTFHWSRMSDQIGRKPVLLMGLFGLSASMWCLGLSKTFWGLVVSRCLNGALNGNIGVMKSMTIELTDPTNIAQACGILPITWSIGTTVGPFIGGSLARPAERFPSIFGNSTLFNRYPYFLPCSVSATVSALSWLVTFMFLRETGKPRMSLRQYLFGGTVYDYESRVNQRVMNDGPVSETIDEQLPIRGLLVQPVIIATGCYATFSLVDIAFYTVLPVFYAVPIEMGGLNLDSPAIGTIFALLGVSGGLIRWIFFARMHDWLGAKPMFFATVSMCLPMIALFPVINAAARVYGLNYLVWFLVGLQITLFVFAGLTSGLALIFIGAAAPNKASIGATNGLAQMVVSVMRAIGPATVNSAFSLSIEKHVMGGHLAYFVMVVMVGLTLWVGYLLPRNLWNH